jgi:hypothetical protein
VGSRTARALGLSSTARSVADILQMWQVSFISMEVFRELYEFIWFVTPDESASVGNCD